MNKESGTKLGRLDFGVFVPGYAAQLQHGFRPRSELAAVKMRPPIDWAMDPFGDRNWCFQLHAWRMLGPIWHELYGNNWQRLKDEVMPWVLDWYEFHVTRGKEAPFSWYDMATGLRAQHLALIAYLHRHGFMRLGSAEASVVQALSEMHVEKLLAPGFIAQNNHGIFQVRGLRLLGAVWAGEPFVKGEQFYSSRIMKGLLTRQFDAHGVHVENSPEYHRLIYKKFNEIRPELFPGIEQQLAKTLQKAKEVLPWFTLPDQTIAAFGDSAGKGEPLAPGARPDLVVETGEGAYWVRDLSKSGYVVIRTHPEMDASRAAMLIMKGQALSRTHAHADHLSVILYHAGRHLLVDSGKFTYNRGDWRDYFISDRAHNVVGLVGGDFGPEDTVTTGPGLGPVSVAEGVVSVEGEVARGEFFCHRRKLEFRPGAWLDVYDQIRARPGDAPVAYWHLAPGIDAERSSGGVDLFSNGQRLARITVSDPQFTPKLIHGSTDPRIQGWVSRSYGAKEGATVIEYRGQPGCADIQTRIELFQPAGLEPGKLPRRLCHGIRFPFSFVFVADRVLVQSDGSTQRMVTVDLPEAYPLAVTNAVSNALQEKGFRVSTQSTGNGTHCVNLIHDDRTHATLRVHTQRDAKPARLVLCWKRVPRKSRQQDSARGGA
ncbi:MAG TPA: alginate lyase family protein [Xanthomonadaceae bacterium]|nr:alginate lyase family protein [Xanthomonadaceae bacterium]